MMEILKIKKNLIFYKEMQDIDVVYCFLISLSFLTFYYFFINSSPSPKYKIVIF